MRLLASELRRLRRPLFLGAAVGVTGVGLILTRAGALLGQASAVKGSEWAYVQVFTSPTGVGRVAAGLMASIPGLVAILALAGGHVAGEWTGGTIRPLLMQDGRRWRWVGGKIASLWMAAMAMELIVWAALAVWTVALRHWWPSTSAMSPAHGLAIALADVARSMLVVAVFAAIGTLAAVVTHSMLGTLLGGMFVVGGSLALSNIAFTRELPSYWLTGWMRFHHAAGAVPYGLWNDRFPPGVPYPGLLVGVAGMVGLFVVAASLSGLIFARSDVA
jgi:ABC-type transport system involved in multi-copper enzyme maturation permease subunit